MFIPVILGTAREGRRSEEVADFVSGIVQENDEVETELIDVRDYLFSGTVSTKQDDKKAFKWRELASRADGFVIVTPEYNHGFPGELKLLIDTAYKEYEKKAVGICGVSNGVLGGARAVELLKPVLNAVGLKTTKRAVYFSNIREGLGGREDEYRKKVEGMLEELVWYAGALKDARDK